MRQTSSAIEDAANRLAEHYPEAFPATADQIWGKPRCPAMFPGDGYSRGDKRCIKKANHPGDHSPGNI